MTAGLRRWTLVAGGAVGVSAAVATAHGAYEVARACAVPAGIAVLYPAITDGLALVAYATTTRLATGARRYAWAIVVLAAGLSGLAQATYLAGSVEQVPTWLRFGIGAWPAVAAALVAHLLYLLAARVEPDVQAPSHSVQASNPLPHPRPTLDLDDVADGSSAARPGPAAVPATARERALAVARDHEAHHGALPTVTALAAAAGVSRGTAATALQELRGARTGTDSGGWAHRPMTRKAPNQRPTYPSRESPAQTEPQSPTEPGQNCPKSDTHRGITIRWGGPGFARAGATSPASSPC